MVHEIKNAVAAQRKHSSEIKQCLDSCNAKFNQILFGVLNEENHQEAHKMEESIYKQLMLLGFTLMQLFFSIQNKGDYGEKIETARGIAKKRQNKCKVIFFNFWKDESD